MFDYYKIEQIYLTEAGMATGNDITPTKQAMEY